MHSLRRSQRLWSHHDGEQPAASKRIASPSTLTPTETFNRPRTKKLRLTEENLYKHQKSHHKLATQTELGRPRKAPTSSSKTTVTTTDKQFASRLVENGVVYESFDAKAPADEQTLKTALSVAREVPQSAHKYWEKIQVAKRQGTQGEMSLESMIVESMLLHHDQNAPSEYQRFRNDQWTEVENEITVGISDPKPDITEAYAWSAYPTGTREEFEELVISQYGYAMPTFAMESKGPSGDHEQAVRQAAYDGAIMTHTALCLEGHMGKEPDNRFYKTKAVTVTLSATEINVYANHAVQGQPGDKAITYHQYRLMRLHYLDSEEEWNKAHAVVYNAQKLALSLADSRIKELHDYFDQKQVVHAAMKGRHEKLQAEALVKAQAAMTPPPSKRVSRRSDDATPDLELTAPLLIPENKPASGTVKVHGRSKASKDTPGDSSG